LLDSSVGWGQDLLFLKAWLDEHPEARPLGLAYYGNMDPRVAGIEFTVPPRGPSYPVPQPPANADQLGPLPGWYAIDVNHVFGNTRVMADGQGGRAPPRIGDDDYRYFQRFEPVARAGRSIWIYRITAEEAARVRRELGLERRTP
jgi:hypothetical protein